MNGILEAICFLSVLTIFMTIAIYSTLKKRSSTVYASKYILSKFEPDNIIPNIKIRDVEILKEVIDRNKLNSTCECIDDMVSTLIKNNIHLSDFQQNTPTSTGGEMNV